jgi:hypothetical protein
VRYTSVKTPSTSSDSATGKGGSCSPLAASAAAAAAEAGVPLGVPTGDWGGGVGRGERGEPGRLWLPAALPVAVATARS